MTRPRRRWPWLLAGLLLGLPALALGALLLLADPQALRPRLEAEVTRATGRSFTVGGLSLGLSLRPTLELTDVALANAPWGSRPAMLTARRMEVQAALLPLLAGRVELSRVLIAAPDLLLETDAEGRGNWLFAPAAAPGTPSATPATPAPPAAPGPALSIAVEALSLEGGRLTWRDARHGIAETLDIASIQASAPGAGATTMAARLAMRGAPIAIEATTGPAAAFAGPAPWPFRLRVAALGVTAQLEGERRGEAWALRGVAEAPDLTGLARLAPGVALPALRQLRLEGAATGRGTVVEGATGLRLTLGESDLAALRPGLTLRRAEASAASLDSPLALSATASLDGVALGLGGTLGPPSILLGRQPGPFAVALAGEAPGAKLGLEGAIADLAALTGIDLQLGLEATGLAALAPLAGRPLPPLGPLRAVARLAERGPGFAEGFSLTGIGVVATEAELEGELQFALAPRPAITGRLTLPRLDLDALRAATPPPTPQAATPPPAPAPPADAPPAATRLIPAQPLPFAALGTLDAALDLAIARLTAQGEAWSDIRARLVLEDGRARLAPFSATTPAGALTLDIAADSRASPPTLRLALLAEALDLGIAARLAGAPPLLTGQARVEAMLAGQGADTRALAATLAGHLGLALADGALARSALAGVPPALLDLLAPGGLPAGDIALRCLALRGPLQAGVLNLATLYAEGALGRLGAGGTVDLGAETLALRLQADLRAGRIAVRAPVNVVGPWRAPRIGVDPAAAAAAGLGALLSQQRSPDRTLQGLAEALGAPRGGPALPDCATALAAARGAAPPPAEPAPPAPPPSGAPNPAGDLLRGLLRR